MTDVLKTGLGAVVASGVEQQDGQGDPYIEPYFSWYPCENCGAVLGGDRYDIQYRETLNGDLYEASICPDCYTELCG